MSHFLPRSKTIESFNGNVTFTKFFLQGSKPKMTYMREEKVLLTLILFNLKAWGGWTDKCFTGLLKLLQEILLIVKHC